MINRKISTSVTLHGYRLIHLDSSNLTMDLIHKLDLNDPLRNKDDLLKIRRKYRISNNNVVKYIIK